MLGYPSYLTRFEIDSAKDDGGLQYVTGRGLAGEVWKNVLRIEPHGFASHPPSGSIGIGVAMGGRRDQIVVLGVEHHGKRPGGLPSGGTALYAADGRIVKFLDAATHVDLKGLPMMVYGTAPIRVVFDVAVRIEAPQVYLGAGPNYARVQTESGVSPTVWATV